MNKEKLVALLRDSRSALEQCQSDLLFVESNTPKSNFQSSILLAKFRIYEIDSAIASISAGGDEQPYCWFHPSNPAGQFVLHAGDPEEWSANGWVPLYTRASTKESKS